jgi:hypothetical protein
MEVQAKEGQSMLRFAFALAAFSLAAPAADAASLLHPSATARKAEKGVSVWRGPALKEAPAPIVAAPAPCVSRTIITYANALPERRLRVQGFWSGDGLTAGMRLARRPLTQGFYADRIAAGY